MGSEFSLKFNRGGQLNSLIWRSSNLNIKMKQKSAESGFFTLPLMQISFESDDSVNFYEFLFHFSIELFFNEIHSIKIFH